jgi:hypothetical protein
MFQPLIPKDERSGLLMQHRDAKCFIVRADELLSAFLELERAIRLQVSAEQI